MAYTELPRSRRPSFYAVGRVVSQENVYHSTSGPRLLDQQFTGNRRRRETAAGRGHFEEVWSIFPCPLSTLQSPCTLFLSVSVGFRLFSSAEHFGVAAIQEDAESKARRVHCK